MRKRFIIRGNVQSVGYRAFIKLAARNLGLRGSVKNRNDGTVEVYCMGDTRGIVRFRRAIERRAADTSDPMQVHVESIVERKWTDEGRFMKPFEVIYDGERVRPVEREMLERSEMAILAMVNMNQNLGQKIDNIAGKQDTTIEKQDRMLEKQDMMLKKQDTMIGKQDTMIGKQDTMIGKQDELIGVVNGRFDEMDGKYGEMSKTMKEIKELFEVLVHHIVQREERERAG